MEDNTIIRQNCRELSAEYKRKIAQQLGGICMEQKTRDYINTLVAEALDNMMPQEKIEQTLVEDNEVVCKMLLKGNPINLLRSVEPIFKSLADFTKSGIVDTAKTSDYILTMMIEKVKKS